MADQTKLKYISRIDTKDTHGWYVRIKKKDINVQKLFSDNKLGNKDWALIQAMIFADECLDQYKPKEDVLVKQITKKSRGYSYPVYQVEWKHGKTVQKKSFSIKKFGQDLAKEKAERFAVNVKKQLFSN